MTLIIADRERQPGVLLVTMNRPERHNALNKPLLLELDATLRDAGADPVVRCVVITGAGERAFSAGADIREQTGFSTEDAYAHMRWGQALFDRVARLPKPTIAAVNGFALGGGLELALACDFRIASESAQLGFPEVNLASLPGWGGTQRLTRLIGASRAKWLAMTGRRLTAMQCLDLGLVNAVHAPAAHLDDALAFAAEIATHEAGSLEAIKQVIDEGIDQTWSEALDAEARAVARLWGTPAQKRAQERFFARRATPPDHA
jgi:enoyl-CoA hydratase/carnithine racemase